MSRRRNGRRVRPFEMISACIVLTTTVLPIKRLGKPEEIADTVLMMVNNGFLTNKVITVDGGLYPY